MSENKDLDQLRQEIDTIDTQIHQLLNQRAECAERVAETKLREFGAENGEGDLSRVMFYRPEREAQVLRKVIDRNSGPLEGKTVARIFREIMSACLALEKPMEVAYFGPEGTFTQAATIKHFGQSVISLPQPSIATVFSQVESGQCNYGVVPVENSTEGMVSHTLDNFMDSPLKICGEVELRIQLHLLANENASSDTIKTICAHQQALAQARNWLDNNWPGVDRIAVASNAEAAKMAKDDASIAAVAGDIAAEQYGLMKIAKSIEDFANNTTRFLIIGNEEVAPSGSDKTSLIVEANNKPGALLKLLEPFQSSGVSLTRIDTRPSRTDTWAYVFFIEFEGHKDDDNIAGILEGLGDHSRVLKVLGSYPKAVL
ncbi:prephenate dehydratase [Oceanicoccus sagamiensis]|uniref:Bifunctional chorismate mutase/prephenate dehydratase n=1 Tax=Oceanicoccus sagamiensis TaxID=716816 RepID=A0A1X9NAG4_9GAMM|nr:prephenate dehydratase [Oceanicoccus sagamiensis]ARN75038.1 chorismate mutase [Oceanicoccus sagamiensis]